MNIKQITLRTKKVPIIHAMYILSTPDKILQYVGSTRNLRHRISAHITALTKRYSSVNPGLQNIYDKYGLSLILEYIEANDREEAFDLEQAYLDKHYGQPYLLNTAKDARASSTGLEVSEKERTRRSQRMLGNQLTKGRTHSAETRRKISESNKGLSRGIGRRMSEKHKETLRKLSLGNKYGVGRVWSEESRKKASESAKNKVITDEARASYRAKAVKQFSTSIICKDLISKMITVFECVTDIERDLGILKHHIRKNLKQGNGQLLCGCLFKFVTDPDVGIWPEYTQQEAIKSRNDYILYIHSNKYKSRATEVHVLNRTTNEIQVFPTMIACAEYFNIDTKAMQYLMGTTGNKKIKIFGNYICKGADDVRSWDDAVTYNPKFHIPKV